MDVRVGLQRKLSTEEFMLLNYGVEEDSWEFLDCKEIQPVYPKGNQSWMFIGKIDAEAETPILWPPDAKNQLIGKDRCWERLKSEGEDREWDGWMASPTWWARVWVNSRSWWKGKPGVLRSMGSQGLGHYWVTELEYLGRNTLVGSSLVFTSVTSSPDNFELGGSSAKGLTLWSDLFNIFVHQVCCFEPTGSLPESLRQE